MITGKKFEPLTEKDSIKNELFQKYSKEEAAFKAFKSSLLDLGQFQKFDFAKKNQKIFLVHFGNVSKSLKKIQKIFQRKNQRLEVKV